MDQYKVGTEVSIWWGGINATIKKVIDNKLLLLRMNDTGCIVWAYIKDNNTLHFMYDDEEFNTKDF